MKGNSGPGFIQNPFHKAKYPQGGSWKQPSCVRPSGCNPSFPLCDHGECIDLFSELWLLICKTGTITLALKNCEGGIYINPAKHLACRSAHEQMNSWLWNWENSGMWFRERSVKEIAPDCTPQKSFWNLAALLCLNPRLTFPSESVGSSLAPPAAAECWCQGHITILNAWKSGTWGALLYPRSPLPVFCQSCCDSGGWCQLWGWGLMLGKKEEGGI